MRKLILLFFAISGSCALIYEVVWTRMLSLVFGLTTFAVSTVLAAFMAGLAIGSYLFGKIIDKKYNQLLFYGLLELGIGLYALSSPHLISLIKGMYINIFKSVTPSFYYFALIRFGLCFLVLLVPTIFMGGTLPILGKFFIKKDMDISRYSAFLYGLNTVGAVCGVLLAGFFFLENLGIRTTIQIAAILNIGIGILSILFGSKTSVISQQAISNSVNTDNFHNTRGPGIILLGFAITGFSAMLYEISWTRILSTQLDSSTYAFSIMLATFLLGIALGSFFFGRYVKENNISVVLFSLLELFLGASVILTMHIFEQIPFYFLKLSIIAENNYIALQLSKFILCIVIMFIPTFILGGIFPIVIKLYSSNLKAISTSIGKAYAFNTIGCILGSFAGGFILIPLIGTRNTILIGVLLNFSLGASLLIYQKRWLYGTASFIIFFSLLFFMPGADKHILSGINSTMLSWYFPGVSRTDALIDSVRKQGKLVYYKEGLNSTISVLRKADHIALLVNGKVDAAITYNYDNPDMRTQLVSGYLPMLLVKEPKNALVIGYGSGVTLRAVSQFPLINIYCVEIEPRVIEASYLFERENRNVINDPRVNIILNDARNYLLLTDKKFDVIISEPSNLWMAGIANLFSLEHFQTIKSHLSDNGIFCQWFHLKGISPEDIRVIIRTFQTAFPHATLWSSFGGDALLIGTKKKLIIDFNEFSQRFYENMSVRKDLKQLYINSPWVLLELYLRGEEGLAALSRNAALNTDDRLCLEFSAPKGLLLDTETIKLNRYFIRDKDRLEFPALTNLDMKNYNDPNVWFDIGYMYLHKEQAREAMEKFEQAKKINDKFAPLYMGLGAAYYKMNNVMAAMSNLNTAVKLDPKLAEAHYILGVIYDQQNSLNEAKREYETSIMLEKDNWMYKLSYASLCLRLSYFDNAIRLFKEVLSSHPDEMTALRGLSTAYIATKREKEAAVLLKEIIDKDPGDTTAYFTLAEVYEKLKELNSAKEVYNELIALFPREAKAYWELAAIYKIIGDHKMAKLELLRALKFDKYLLYR